MPWWRGRWQPRLRELRLENNLLVSFKVARAGWGVRVPTKDGVQGGAALLQPSYNTGGVQGGAALLQPSYNTGGVQGGAATTTCSVCMADY